MKKKIMKGHRTGERDGNTALLMFDNSQDLVGHGREALLSSRFSSFMIGRRYSMYIHATVLTSRHIMPVLAYVALY